MKLMHPRDGRAPHLPRLGVNIDHVATVRNARGGRHPDPVRAALQVIAAGADGITAHLREDRRHIRDADMHRLKSDISVPLNFEMAATAEMLAIATAVKPHACCLVPERREERTTEGGLDVAGQHNTLVDYVARLKDAGIRVSLFIAADPRQIEASARVQADIVELHTGAWCEALADGHGAQAAAEEARLRAGIALADAAGLEVHAGHGLDFASAEVMAAEAAVVELNIGHFLVGEAIFRGLDATVAEMRAAMARGRARVAA
jgi:pyridoxine 5-phosphate synthase